MSREAQLIPADHPALPGHFPGNPVVPGVVLLGRVIDAAAQMGLGPVTALPQVKFLAVLHPEALFRVEIEMPGSSGRRPFRCVSVDGPETVIYCTGLISCDEAP